MRKYLSYANVVATFALLFAMSGGALAAQHYLLNSVKQINPRVLSELRLATAGTLWAQITSEGTVNTSSPGVKAARFGVGIYEVSFGRDISKCMRPPDRPNRRSSRRNSWFTAERTAKGFVHAARRPRLSAWTGPFTWPIAAAAT